MENDDFIEDKRGICMEVYELDLFLDEIRKGFDENLEHCVLKCDDDFDIIKKYKRFTEAQMCAVFIEEIANYVLGSIRDNDVNHDSSLRLIRFRILEALKAPLDYSKSS